MNEIDSLKAGLQSLSADVQNLSNAVKAASANMQSAGAGIVNNITNASSYAQNMSANVMSRAQGAYSMAQSGMNMVFSGRGEQVGFSGSPTGVPYNMPVPLATPKRESVLMNVFSGNFNNEYNKPSSWFRDILAISGKQFVDVQSEEAKEYAKRNWGSRGKAAGWEALGLAMWSGFGVPGLGLPLGAAYEFIAKPMIMEDDRRRQAYFSFIDKTGARNVDARLSATGKGGYTMEQADEMSKIASSGYKGTGYKKSQWDEIMQVAEQAGYFKTYDKATINSYQKKIEQLGEDAKYAVQTLHVTATDAAQILGGLSKLSGAKPAGSTSQINLLNQASAYTGLSPMQMNEYAMGRMGKYTAIGYSETAGYNASLREIVNIIKNTPIGEKPSPEKVLGVIDTMSSAWRGDPKSAYLMSAFFTQGKDGLKIDMEKWNKYVRGGGDIKTLVDEGMGRFGTFTSDQQIMASRGGLMKLMEASGAYTPEQLNTGYASMALRFYMSTQNKDIAKMIRDNGGRLSDEMLASIAGGLQGSMGVDLSIKDLRKAIERGELINPEYGKIRRIAREDVGYKAATIGNDLGKQYAATISKTKNTYKESLEDAKKYRNIIERFDAQAGKDPYSGEESQIAKVIAFEARERAMGRIWRKGDASRVDGDRKAKLDKLIEGAGSEAELYNQFSKLKGKEDQAGYFAWKVKKDRGIDLRNPYRSEMPTTPEEQFKTIISGGMQAANIQKYDKMQLEYIKQQAAEYISKKAEFLEGGGANEQWYKTDIYSRLWENQKTALAGISKKNVEDISNTTVGRFISAIDISRDASGQLVTAHGQSADKVVEGAINSINANASAVDRIVSDSKTQTELNTNLAANVELNTNILKQLVPAVEKIADRMGN